MQRVLTIYTRIKPLLTVFSSLSFIPNVWRAALVRFMEAIEALTSNASDALPAFKAGKDL